MNSRRSRPEVFCKKVVLKNFPKFTVKHLWSLRPATLLKKRLQHRCFPVNFEKFLRTPFCTEHFWWLLLQFLCYHIDYESNHQTQSQDIVCKFYQTDSEASHQWCNVIEIALWQGCSPVHLLHIFGTPFPKNTYDGCVL